MTLARVTEVVCACTGRVSVTVRERRVSVSVGSQATLRCVASGRPAPRFQWLWDGGALSERANARDGVLTSVPTPHPTPRAKQSFVTFESIVFLYFYFIYFYFIYFFIFYFYYLFFLLFIFFIFFDTE